MEKEFNEILKEFLEENNLSQLKFAEIVGIKQNQVSEWLKSKKPSYESLQKICTAFDISADYFLGFTDMY